MLDALSASPSGPFVLKILRQPFREETYSRFSMKKARLLSKSFALLSEGYHGYPVACSCGSRALLGLPTLSQVYIEGTGLQ